MQNKKSYKHEFSKRLREVMLLRGYGSTRSCLGVSPKALCDALDGHLEISLRYLDGRSIPDPETLLKISTWLRVDPGTLLFGNASRLASIEDKDIFRIDKSLLEYAITKLLQKHKKSDNVSDKISFLMSVLTDLSALEVGKDQLKKIFDLTIKSSDTLIKSKVVAKREHG